MLGKNAMAEVLRVSSQLARWPGSGKFPKSLSRVDGVGKHAFVAGGNYAAS